MTSTPAGPSGDGRRLIPGALRPVLAANAADPGGDPVPVLKLFHPTGPGTWLIAALDPDGDTLSGLCDLGMGCPELGYASLSEIASARLPLGLGLERDGGFQGRVRLSRWAELARQAGSIRRAEAIVRRLPPAAG